jgi:hypothetical protein
MSIFEKITRCVQRVFKTNLEIFLEALKLSPNAQGYVSGSITELLLKKKLEEEYGFEVKRIREKWEGRKHPRHHGDFYLRKPGSPCAKQKKPEPSPHYVVTRETKSTT